MMMLFSNLFQFVDVDKLGKLIEMEHAFVPAMFAEKCHILAQIHILKVICDKTSVASLNALSEFADDSG